jgi:stage V sporulation protein B
MLSIATTVLTSIGREVLAALLTLGAVIAVAISCFALVGGTDFGADGHALLVRSAEATAAALVTTLVVAGAIVRSSTGAFVPAPTALRAALALAGCLALGLVLPRFGRLVTPLVSIVVAGAYVLALVVTREIGRADVAMVRALASKRR